MGRLTSAGNNGGRMMRQDGSGTSTAQIVTVAVIAFLAHRVTAIPLPPISISPGCCVSYGLAYDHTECCHEFSSVSTPTECAVQPGWVGGGKRFHAETTCEEAQAALGLPHETTMHEDSATADRGEDAGCCVSFGLTGTAECCHEFTSSSAPEECELPSGWVGGGRRFHSTNCADTQQLAQYSVIGTPREPPAGEADMGGWIAAVFTPEQQTRLGVDMWGQTSDDNDSSGATSAAESSATGRTQPVGYSPVLEVAADGYGYGDGAGSDLDEDNQVSISDYNSPSDDAADTSVPMVGGSQSLGPVWTQDDHVDLDAGDDTDTGEDDFSPTGDVLAPDHDDSKDYDSQSDNEEQDSDANVPMVGGSQSLGPVWTQDDSLEPPAGQQDMGGWMAAVYTPEQQARLGVDEFGVQIQEDAQDQLVASPMMVTSSTQTDISPADVSLDYVKDDSRDDVGFGNQQQAALQSAPDAGVDLNENVESTNINDTPDSSEISLRQKRVFSWIGGGAAGLVLLTVLLMMGVTRCRRSSNLRVSAYTGFTDAQGNAGEYHRAKTGSTAPPHWATSWVVSGVGIGDSFSAPVEPAAPPPEADNVDRVSLVGMPRPPSTLQFSTNRR